MTQKDYILIAKNVASLPDDAILDKERLTAFLADICESEREKFNRDKFFKACLNPVTPKKRFESVKNV
jgi:hypothetical protein